MRNSDIPPSYDCLLNQEILFLLSACSQPHSATPPTSQCYKVNTNTEGLPLCRGWGFPLECHTLRNLLCKLCLWFYQLNNTRKHDKINI